MNPKNSRKFTQHSCCSMLTREKKLKAIRGNGYRFVPKVGAFPTETIMLVVRSSGLWEAYPKPAPNGTKNLPRHVEAAPWYHAKFHEFQMSFGFTRIWKPGISMFAAKWRWQGVWHSFPFLAWDLSMQPRTHIWIFNQFICFRACACSSNLNYAHKCIENSINA